MGLFSGSKKSTTNNQYTNEYDQHQNTFAGDNHGINLQGGGTIDASDNSVFTDQSDHSFTDNSDRSFNDHSDRSFTDQSDHSFTDNSTFTSDSSFTDNSSRNFY